MSLLDIFQHSVLAASVDVAKALIALTYNRFPNQELCGIDVSQLVGPGAILRYPGRVNITGVAILQDSADKGLDGIRINRLVEGRGIVIPKGFILGGKRVGVVDGRPRFDAVRHLALIRAHGKGRKHIVGVHIPAIHKLEVVPLPMVAVGLGVTRKANHIDFGALSGSICRRTEPNKHGKAHEQGQDQRHAFPLNSRCHKFFSFSARMGNKKRPLRFAVAMGLFFYHAYPI